MKKRSYREALGYFKDALDVNPNLDSAKESLRNVEIKMEIEARQEEKLVKLLIRFFIDILVLFFSVRVRRFSLVLLRNIQISGGGGGGGLLTFEFLVLFLICYLSLLLLNSKKKKKRSEPRHSTNLGN